MRKINTANKRSFGIFGAIILILLISFCAITFFAVKNGTEAYATDKGLVVFDKNVELINTDSNGDIAKSWNGEYFLTLNGGDKYNLGKNNVVFDPRSKEVRIYGAGYKVNVDGSVESIDNETIVTRSSIKSNLFKLDDRRYLITGGDIFCIEQNFQTRYYLEIFIDKSGNAQLVNEFVNQKTVKPMTLISGDIQFDIGNEKLKIGDKEIDLKVIGGSTNQYKGDSDKDKDKKSDTNNSSSSSSTTQQVISGGGGGSGSGSGGSQQTVPANLDRDIMLRGTKSDVTSIKVDYDITDIENKYVSCYLLVKKATDPEDPETRIELNKAHNSVELRSLRPDTLYQISLCYDMYVKENGKDVLKPRNVQNTVRVKTATIDSEIVVERITSKYIYLTITTDDMYVLDSANLKLYLDDDKEPYIITPVNIKKSINGGWSTRLGVADVSKETEKYTLLLDDAKYGVEGEEQPMTVNLRSKVVIKNTLYQWIVTFLSNMTDY